ncbi:hypothetical protein [Parasitella parasitica]|uniref:Reverse transcriptase domain-containing protein n=1 Tax=Parasitella parasitica TaxID=35722 RepID=A0A0B7NQ95_9FUNG|nr:hypothetical protein [Parasitella parasitica]
MSINLSIPLFTGKEDPNHWLYRYEKIALVNKWSDDEKLVYVDTFLSESLQLWSMEKQFNTFAQFKAELLAKHTKKVDLNKVVSDITNFKMKEKERISDYITRFEAKRSAYQTEVTKRKLATQTSINSKEKASASTTTKLYENEDTIELIITETGFLKYFLKGITDKNIKRFAKTNKGSNLQGLYTVLRDIFDDSDSETDSDASNNDSVTDSEEEANNAFPKNKKNTRVKDKKTGKTYDMDDLSAQFKDMVLMVVEEIRKTKSVDNKRSEPNKRKKVNYYNCDEPDHIAQYSQPRVKRPPRVTRSGAVYGVPQVIPRVIQEVDVDMRETRPSGATLNGATNAQVEVQSTSDMINVPLARPEHPLLPKEQPGDKEARVLSNVERIVDRMVNEAVIPMSFSEVAAISPSARSLIKQSLTKPQAIKRAKRKTPLVEDDQVLLGETSLNLPKGKSAPRAYGSVNGNPCELILDGGCTSFIISLNFLRKLGITQVESTKASVMFGDGKSQEVIGIARNLQLRVGQSELVSVSALCFDVGDKYDFIVGREGLHALNIGTDWATHYWYIKTNEAILPLEVHYVKNHTREGFDTTFLVTQAKRNTLTRMIVRRVTSLFLLETRAIFGTDYKHMSTTNLLKFHVDTGDHKPIYKKPYGFLSFSEKETLKKDLEDMVSNGILVPITHVSGNSKSGGWSFPCRYVPKKDGQKRLVTNFRDLNAITVRDPWPMPNVTDVLESLAGSKWFVCCDLLKAFQQIAVEEASIPKLTIASPWGSYSYRCLPFGVLNGPAAFGRCVFLAIQPFLNKFAVNFYDDCTLYAETKELMIKHTKTFLERMREVNLKLNSDKKHIPHFSDIAAPMNELLEKSKRFNWEQD